MFARVPWVPCVAFVVACGPAAAPPPATPATPARPTLDLRADGIGPVLVGRPVSADSLRAALPGLDVHEEEASYEDIPVPRLVVADGDATLFWITPEDGRAAVIVVTAPAASSALGVNVGSSYADVVAALGPLECEVGYDDDTFAFQPICTNTRQPDVVVVFAQLELPEHIMPGDAIAPDRTDAVLATARVDAIVI